MFKIIGGDGNEYGPVSLEVLRDWLKQGRVNAATRVRHEGGEWTTLGQLSEFGELKVPGLAQAPAIPLKLSNESAVEPEPVLRRYDTDDYRLSYRDCLARGWQAVRENLGLALIGAFLCLGVGGGLNSFAKLPFDRVVFGLIATAASLPLIAGLSYLLLRAVRSEAVSFGNLFAGFRCFSQILCTLGMMLLVKVLCFAPAALFAAIALLPAWQSHQPLSKVALEIFGGIVLLGLIPYVHIQVSWMFALPLLVDRRLTFRSALKLSWQRTHAHWWQVFGLYLVLAVVAPLGVLGCGVGLLVTFPLAVAAGMAAYDDIFPPLRS